MGDAEVQGSIIWQWSVTAISTVHGGSAIYDMSFSVFMVIRRIPVTYKRQLVLVSTRWSRIIVHGLYQW